MQRNGEQVSLTGANAPDLGFARQSALLLPAN